MVALSLHLSRGRMCACALSDRRYIALLCSYTFSVLLLHRCVLFVFPLSLYHSQRTSTPHVCMSISVGNRIDGIFIFCIETHRSVLFVVTPSSCCPYNVQSERLLQLSACAFLGRASTRMPTVHSSKFCFHIVVPVTFTGNVYPTCLSGCALLGSSLTRMPTIYISVLSSYTS